jgi:hypothetical protein
MMYAYLPPGAVHGGTKIDVTTVRGAPTTVSNISTTDPFGPAAATLEFPSITMLDAIGTGDLYWLQPEYDVDIVWVSSTGHSYTWEGFFTSFEYTSEESGSTLTVTCAGAMKQLDYYLAKPEYPRYPIPYEHAIRNQFLDRPDLRMATPPVATAAFPDWWTTTFNSLAYDSSQPWTVPSYVLNGDKWSGLVTRDTGNFSPALSEYIAGLLSNMQTPLGQFTLLLQPGRKPTMSHRTIMRTVDSSTLSVDLLWPGVTFEASKDYSQRASVVYTHGQSRAGLAYTGMEVSSNMSLNQFTTYYDPSAYSYAVHPQLASNLDWDTTVMRKEVKADFGDGLTPKEARVAAQNYLSRVTDPGITGTLTLNTDPVMSVGSAPYPRQIIQAGQSILIKGLFGDTTGVLFHVTETQTSEDGSTTLTVDSLYRDHLTVDQVRFRGRDALIPFRSISTAGTYSPAVPDQLYPWSQGASGVIPDWSTRTTGDLGIFRNSAARLANDQAAGLYLGDPDNVPFPWTDITTRFPPKNYPQYYITVHPASRTNPEPSWANAAWVSSNTEAQNLAAFVPYKILMAQAGEIKLLQMAAYDANGNVKNVPFHVSIYSTSGVTPQFMPLVPSDAVMPADSRYTTAVANGKHYPFFATAWEKINPNGTVPTNTQQDLPATSDQFMIGYGSYYEKAGYWPGSSAKPSDKPTGLLVDEAGFSWDWTGTTKIDPQKTFAQQASTANPYAYIMVYCDADVAANTYFLGRMFRKELSGM